MKSKLVRLEKPEDIAAVRQVNVAAFGRDGEADLVDKLRGIAGTYSFVAVVSEQVVGHIFFSPVTIAGESPPNLFLLGLAPVAVLPAYQHQGIGSLLIRHSLAECDHFSVAEQYRLGCQAVFVLGNPQYYSRFGFITAQKKELKCEYPLPEEAFMVLELAEGVLAGCRGTVKYRSEFANLE